MKNPFPCQRYRPMPVSRRDMLRRSASGFGAMALAALGLDPAYGADGGGKALHGPHHKATAKNVIFLYMDGGPSQIDTFDPKPLLDKYNGKDPKKLFKVEPTQFNNNGKVLASPWKFKQYGESGLPVSSLFPHVASCADDLAVIRSLTSEFPEHTFANYFLHTGSGMQGRPSCFGSGFLPASYQGSTFLPSGTGIANIRRTEPTDQEQRSKLDLVRKLDGFTENNFGSHDSLESAIRNYELAYSMQMAVPDVMSLNEEPDHIKKMYGMEAEYKHTRTYGAQCLIARRMIERGVRFIELTCPAVQGDRQVF